MRRTAELKTAIESADSPEDVLALWDDWQGKGYEFWYAAAQFNQHWDDNLIRLAVVAKMFEPLAQNSYIPRPLVSRLSLWLANRVVGDRTQDVRLAAVRSLSGLIAAGKVSEKDEAFTVFFNFIVRRGVRVPLTSTDAEALDLMISVPDISTVTIDQIVAAVEHRPQNHAGNIHLGLLKPYVFHPQSSPARWTWALGHYLPGGEELKSAAGLHPGYLAQVLNLLRERDDLRKDPMVRTWIREVFLGLRSPQNRISAGDFPGMSDFVGLLIADAQPDAKSLQAAVVQVPAGPRR